MAMTAKANFLLAILIAVAEMSGWKIALADVRADAFADKIPRYVHAIKVSSDPGRREELSEELEHRLKRDGAASLSDADIMQIESLLDDSEVRSVVEDMLADIGVRAKGATPHLFRLLHTIVARDHQLVFGPDLPEEGSICNALWKIDGAIPDDCQAWGFKPK